MILFFGPAGSGKSTQAQMMVDMGGWSCLSMGQLLRDTTNPEVHEIQAEGVLVPTEITSQILCEAFNKFKSNANHLILDGYPRNLSQVNWLIENCETYNIKIDIAVNFNVGLEELLKRMELRGRNDDNPESIKERLAIYYKEIDPILGLLSKNAVEIVHINGFGSRDDVHKRVVEEISKYNSF